MSLATRHMIDRVTYWTRLGANDRTNPYASGTWSAPVTVVCEFESGGKLQRDQNGEEFMPGSTYYTVANIPRGAMVVLGASTEAEPPSHAEKVRKAGGGTSLRAQVSEFVIYTG